MTWMSGARRHWPDDIWDTAMAVLSCRKTEEEEEEVEASVSSPAPQAILVTALGSASGPPLCCQNHGEGLKMAGPLILAFKHVLGRDWSPYAGRCPRPRTDPRNEVMQDSKSSQKASSSGRVFQNPPLGWA